VVIIKFPGRQKHPEQIELHHKLLRSQTRASSVITVRTCVAIRSAGGRPSVPRIRWFTLIDADNDLIERARQFADRLTAIEDCKADVICAPPERNIQGPDLERPIIMPSESSLNPLQRLMRRLGMLPAPSSDQLSGVHEKTTGDRNQFSAAANAVGQLSSSQDRGRPTQCDELPTPICDWIYFATPTPAGLAKTQSIVRECRMILRTVFNTKGMAIANVKKIKPGDTILLVHGGGNGSPYRPVFECHVVASPRPVPGFPIFSFADEVQEKLIQDSGYPRDPHFHRFTGIPIEISRDLSNTRGSIPRPLGNNTIRTWKEVFGDTGSGSLAE